MKVLLLQSQAEKIKKKCEQVGFKVTNVCYADFLGFFASLIMKFSGYDSKSGIGSISTLKFYDKWLFPISKFLDRIGFRFIVGKNLILEAEKLK